MKYIILRPGISEPTEAEAQLMRRIHNGSAMGCPVFPGVEMSGTLSFVTTDLTKEEIALEYQKISTAFDESMPDDEKEVFPVMIFEVSETFAYNLDMACFMGFGKAVGEPILGISPTIREAIKPNISKMDMDQLLDIMEVKGGFDNMSEEEQARMKKLSEDLNK